MAMHCTACSKRTHKVTRVGVDTWLCPDCHTPAPKFVKAMPSDPPKPGTLKLAGFLVKISVGQRPDYSRN
jgi:hypothetical protein